MVKVCMIALERLLNRKLTDIPFVQSADLTSLFPILALPRSATKLVQPSRKHNNSTTKPSKTLLILHRTKHSALLIVHRVRSTPMTGTSRRLSLAMRLVTQPAVHKDRHKMSRTPFSDKSQMTAKISSKRLRRTTRTEQRITQRRSSLRRDARSSSTV